MTIFSTNVGGGMAPLALPWLRLCFGAPLGNFLRTPLPSVKTFLPQLVQRYLPNGNCIAH